MLQHTNNSNFVKECIVESLFYFLRKKPLEAISIKELTQKAGVNRSTYYRNFNSKVDIVKYYYALLLDSYVERIKGTSLTLEEYLEGMFNAFLEHREELLLLERENLSILLLDVLNTHFITSKDGAAIQTEMANYYHIGGVFNMYESWLKSNFEMNTHDLAKYSVEILPKSFAPLLPKCPYLHKDN